MDSDSMPINLNQPTLFDFTGTSSGTVELFPTVWSAAEELTSPDVEVRQSSLERLAAIHAIRLSPLIAYLTATRLLEPEMSLRKRVVQLLGEVLAPDEAGRPAPEPVVRHLSVYLAQMRTRPIVSLLQVIELDPQLEAAAARLLNACPYGGSQLADIVSDRKVPVSIRVQAVRMIGLVGYLDTLPTLERLEARLNARIKGQQSMPFAPPSGPDESELLPAVQTAIGTLRGR
jgi:HEAT repeat protein